MRYITVDDKIRPLDEEKLYKNLEKHLGKVDTKYIIESACFLLADLEFDTSFMNGKQPEEYYAKVISDYIADHSVKEFVNCEDDCEIWDYA